MNARSLKYIVRIEVVHFDVSVFLIAKVVTIWAQEQEATVGLFEDYSGEIVNGSKHVGFYMESNRTESS